MPTPPICLSAYVPNELKSAIGERHRGGDRDPIADNSLREDKDERIHCPLLTAPLRLRSPCSWEQRWWVFLDGKFLGGEFTIFIPSQDVDN